MVVRGLDKVNAQVSDLEIANGGEMQFGRLTLLLQECRYPKDDPAGDAFAYLTIVDSKRRGGGVFRLDAGIFARSQSVRAPSLRCLGITLHHRVVGCLKRHAGNRGFYFQRLVQQSKVPCPWNFDRAK